MRVEVKVRTSAQKERIELEDGRLVVSLKEPARKGKANLALVKLLAGRAGCSSAEVAFVSGLSSRRKVLEFPDCEIEKLLG